MFSFFLALPYPASSVCQDVLHVSIHVTLLQGIPYIINVPRCYPPYPSTPIPLQNGQCKTHLVLFYNNRMWLIHYGKLFTGTSRP
jgi:hypothetical protein